MQIDMLTFVFGLSWGVAIGAWWASQWHMKHRKAEIKVVKVVVDQALLDQANAQMAMYWLQKNGYVWQPIGAVFDPMKKFESVKKHG
ncbi:MAG: hypothetical protein WB870_09560 [Gallionellaceae bacterium]